MEASYKATCEFLVNYIKINGRTKFINLTSKDYNKLAREYNLMLTPSLEYISGHSWREFKNKVLSENK